MSERRVGGKQFSAEGEVFAISIRQLLGEESQGGPEAAAEQNSRDTQRYQLQERSEHQGEGAQAQEQRQGDPWHGRRQSPEPETRLETCQDP